MCVQYSDIHVLSTGEYREYAILFSLLKASQSRLETTVG